MGENMAQDDRVQRYADAIVLANNTETRIAAARRVMAVADAEQAELRETLDGLRNLRVEDYAKLDEAFDRTHRAEDKLARVEALAEEWEGRAACEADVTRYKTQRDAFRADNRMLRAKVAQARRRLWTLGELVAEECAESDGEELCHEHDRTDSGGCALLTDPRAAYAELAGPEPACTCGEVWKGHPNPHAITCPAHRAGVGPEPEATEEADDAVAPYHCPTFLPRDPNVPFVERERCHVDRPHQPHEHTKGLFAKYHVERLHDPSGKHAECRYFVLDPQHDPLARKALRAYADAAKDADLNTLSADLRGWLAALAGPEATTTSSA